MKNNESLGNDGFIVKFLTVIFGRTSRTTLYQLLIIFSRKRSSLYQKDWGLLRDKPRQFLGENWHPIILLNIIRTS